MKPTIRTTTTATAARIPFMMREPPSPLRGATDPWGTRSHNRRRRGSQAIDGYRGRLYSHKNHTATNGSARTGLALRLALGRLFDGAAEVERLLVAQMRRR